MCSLLIELACDTTRLSRQIACESRMLRYHQCIERARHTVVAQCSPGKAFESGVHTTRRVPMLEESDATPLAVHHRAHSVYNWEANVSIVASKHLIVTRTILRRGEKKWLHACVS